jgi:hypothetical protein
MCIISSWRFCWVFFPFLFNYFYLFNLFYKCNLKVEQVNSMPPQLLCNKAIFKKKKKKGKKSHKASAWIAQARFTHMQTHPNRKRQKTTTMSFLKKIGWKCNQIIHPSYDQKLHLKKIPPSKFIHLLNNIRKSM